jgi:RNA polymerase sigma factor (sigma-70 family)
MVQPQSRTSRNAAPSRYQCQMAQGMNAPPFQALIDEHREPVLAFLRGTVGATDADDCLQETFLSALRAYPPADARNLRGWLFKIAHNKAIDHFRSRAVAPRPAGEPERLDVGAADAAPGWLGGRSLDDRPARDSAIWSAVGELPEGQRAAVILRFAVDLRYGEIGTALECSEDAARRRVHDGLRNLRAAVTPAGEGATT